MAPNASKPLVRRMFALFREGGVEQREHRLAVSSFITWRTIDSVNDLTEVDIRAVVGTLEYWKSCGEIEYRCRRIADKIQGAHGAELEHRPWDELMLGEDPYCHADELVGVVDVVEHVHGWSSGCEPQRGHTRLRNKYAEMRDRSELIRDTNGQIRIKS